MGLRFRHIYFLFSDIILLSWDIIRFPGSLSADSLFNDEEQVLYPGWNLLEEEALCYYLFDI